MKSNQENKEIPFGVSNYEEGKCIAKKYVSIREGMILYSMGRDMFRALAMDAGALYQIRGKILLVNTETFEQYLESFKLYQTR